jgi:tetratricopeptide (TPR) repeat protein
MLKGNSKSAIYWAKYVIYHRPESFASYTYLANAYELDGQYEKAMESYADAQNYANLYDGRHSLPDTPRVEYKLNRKKEAFWGYCQYVDQDAKKYFEPFKVELWNERHRALSAIHDRITFQHSHHSVCLSPFLKYRDFLDFMEEEYQKLGEPPEYAAAMELFRAIATEIDEAHLP